MVDKLTEVCGIPYPKKLREYDEFDDVIMLSEMETIIRMVLFDNIEEHKKHDEIPWYVLINLLSKEQKLDLIKHYRMAYDSLHAPTEEMKRLHELKWKI